jgi:O-antigen/teichoic acid export membrane protein
MLTRVFKNAASLIVAGIIDKLAYVLLFAVLARKLTKAEFGAYSLVLTLVLMGGMAVNFGIESVVIREVAKDRSRAKALFNSGILLAVLFSGVAWPSIVFSALLLGYGSEVVYLLGFGGAVLAFMGLGQISVAIIKAYERMEILVLVGLFTSVMSLMLNLGVLWLGWSIAGLMAVLLLSEGVKAAFFVTVVHRRFVPFSPGFDRRVTLDLLRLTLPFTLLMVCGALVHRVDLLIMGWIRPIDEVAVYGMATKFADILSLIGGGFAVALYPMLSSKVTSAPEELWGLYSDSIGVLAIFGFGAAVAVTALAEPMILLLFGHKYIVGATALRWLGWSFLFATLSGPVGILLFAAGDQINRLLMFTLAVLCCTVAFNMWLIPLYSYNGAAVAAFLSTVAGFLGRLVLSRSYFGRLPHIFIVWRALTASILMGLLLISTQGLPVLVRMAAGGVIYCVILGLLGEFHEPRYAPLRLRISRYFVHGEENA